MENQITKISDVLVWIRMGVLPGVGLILIVIRKETSSA